MHVLISMETHPFTPAVMAEGIFNVPACKLNEELTNPAVLLIHDSQRAVVSDTGERENVPYPSEWLAFGKTGDVGLLFRDENSPTEVYAAFIVPRGMRDRPELNEKLGLPKNLKELKAKMAELGYPIDDCLPTEEELRACLRKREMRDRKLIDLGNQLYAEHRENPRFVPSQCREALVHLGIHRAWESFADKEAIDAQIQYLTSKNVQLSAAVSGRR